jgi:hypothetical protein
MVRGTVRASDVSGACWGIALTMGSLAVDSRGGVESPERLQRDPSAKSICAISQLCAREPALRVTYNDPLWSDTNCDSVLQVPLRCSRSGTARRCRSSSKPCGSVVLTVRWFR